MSALMLLAAVMTSPIRPAITALASGRSPADCLRRNFGMPGKAGPTHHRPHAPTHSRVVQVKALSSHQELDWASDSGPHHRDLTDIPFPAPGWHSPALILEQTAHPLRC